jgi:hypothetical protein
MKDRKTVPTDPLYTIFEQHLFNFQDSEQDRKAFIVNIVRDYMAYLRRMNITVPKSLEEPMVEELYEQVNVMLVKKIYGCSSIEEYQKGVKRPMKRRARTRYKRLTSVASAATSRARRSA